MFIMDVNQDVDAEKKRYTYYARKSDDSYREVKSEARKGINLTP